jgi:hypothetical protein
VRLAFLLAFAALPGSLPQAVASGRSSPSEAVATEPGSDPDADGLTNQEEADRLTNPLDSDSDDDGLGDFSDAMPIHSFLRFPAARESRYAVLDLGTDALPVGINDSGDILLLGDLQQGNEEEPPKQEGWLWHQGSIEELGEELAGFWRGPLNNRKIYWARPAEDQPVTDAYGNGTSKRLAMFERSTLPGSNAQHSGRLFTETIELEGPLPVPPRSPGTTILNSSANGTLSRTFDRLAANLDPPMSEFQTVPGGGTTVLRVSLGAFADSGQTAFTFEMDSQGIWMHVPSSQPYGIRLEVFGFGLLAGTMANSAFALGINAVEEPPRTRLPNDPIINDSGDLVGTVDEEAVIADYQMNLVPLDECGFPVDLAPRRSSSRTAVLGSFTDTGNLGIWGVTSSGSNAVAPVRGALARTDSRATSRRISQTLTIPLAEGIWRNGRFLPLHRLLGGTIGGNGSLFASVTPTLISPSYTLNAPNLIAGTATRTNGSQTAVLLVPCDIAVDANRDGVIKLAGGPSTAAAPDKTEESKPFRFWVNNDDDEADGTENVPVVTPDNRYAFIEGKRDLEDFSRLHIHVGGLLEAIRNGAIQIALEWRPVEGTPAIWVHRAESPSGSDSYLTDDQAAGRQVDGVYGVALGKAAHDAPLFIDASALQSLSPTNPNACFLFDGAAEGKGEIVMTFWKAGHKIGEGPGVWIELLDVKKMYVRGHAVPDLSDQPFDHMDSWSPPAVGSAPYDNGHAFSKPDGEEETVVVYVHGINGPGGQSDAYGTWQADSETVFKRLWHQGFKGRFASFKWLALTPAWPFKFNESEYRGWKSGQGLARFLGTLPSDYQKNLYSFSQGAIVCGSALTVYQASVQNYVMSQAAAPAGSYDASNEINSYTDFLNAEATLPTPDGTNDLGYRGCLSSLNVGGAVVSFFNTVDYALKTGRELGINVSWEGNQISYKPNANMGALGYRTYAYDSGPPSDPFPIGQRCFLRDVYMPFNERLLSDIHESMSFVARPRSEAAGASNVVGGRITGRYNVGPGSTSAFDRASADHGGQFSRSIQGTQDYYEQLLMFLTEE